MPPFWQHLANSLYLFVWGPQPCAPVRITVEIYKRYSPLSTIDSVPGNLPPEAYRQAMEKAIESEFTALKANYDMEIMRDKTPWIDHSPALHTPQVIPLNEAPASLAGASPLILLGLTLLGGGLYLLTPQILLLFLCGQGTSLAASTLLLSLGLPSPLALALSLCLRLLVIHFLKGLSR